MLWKDCSPLKEKKFNMALTGHFLDFKEEVARVRGKMIAEIYSMMTSQLSIQCNEGDFTATMSDGSYPVTLIQHSPETDEVVFVMDDVYGDGDEQLGIDELTTDDLVALYEFVFGVLYPDQN
jgi:hypothetical protein